MRKSERRREGEGQSARESEIGRGDGSNDIMPIMKSKKKREERNTN
jgi:hypothetical protein